MVLTSAQEELRRKRKKSAAVTEEQEEKGREKRGEILSQELAEARAKQRGKVAVKTPEGFEERTPEEAALVPSLPEQERLARQEEFRQEDVTKIQTEVAAEQELLPESVIQESERARVEAEAARKEESIKRGMEAGLTREQAELGFEATNPEMQAALKQSTGDKILGGARQLFGDVGKDLIGLSLNQVLDVVSGDLTTLSSLTGQMSEAASLLPAIEGSVNNEGINPFRALAELNSAERDGEIIRGDMDRLAVLRPEIVQTKEYLEMRVELDVYIADIRDARGTALEKLRTAETEFNILETQAFIDDIEERKKKKEVEKK